MHRPRLATVSYRRSPRTGAAGHKLSFAMSSKILSRGTREWQLSGDESERYFGSTPPTPVARRITVNDRFKAETGLRNMESLQRFLIDTPWESTGLNNSSRHSTA